jgi:hypothetical protein
LLGIAVDLMNRLVQATDVVVLRTARRTDLFHDAGDALDRAQNLLHRRAGAFDQLCPRATSSSDAPTSFLTSFAAVAERCARLRTLAGHHREAATLFACARGLRRPRSVPNRFVWKAISSITPMMSPIRRDEPVMPHGRDHFARLRCRASRAVRLRSEPLALQRVVVISPATLSFTSLALSLVARIAAEREDSR